MLMGRDVATVFVVAGLVLMLGWVAYVSCVHPRRDPWTPRELSHVLPVSTAGYRLNGAVVKTEDASESFLGNPSAKPASNRANIFSRENAAADGLATRPRDPPSSPARHHVSYVFALRSIQEVPRVAAPAVVTGVPND